MVNFGYIKVERRTVSNRVATSAGNSSLLAPDSKGPPPKSCPPVESFLKSSAPPDSTERKFHSQLLAPDTLPLSLPAFFSPPSPHPSSHFGREFCSKARRPRSRFPDSLVAAITISPLLPRLISQALGRKASRNFI